MSIRRTSIDRLNEARKSGRPTIAKGKPLNAQGDDGDLTFRRTSDGLKLYIKAAGRWNGVKVGESFDDLEKSLNNLQKIVSTIKKFKMPNKIVLDYDVVDAGAGKTNASPLHIDYDRTGDVSSGTDINTALDIDLNVTGASNGTITSTGAQIDVVGDSGGTSTARGLGIDVTGADTNEGIRIETPDGSADIVMMSPNNSDDYCSISVTAEGATTIATNDDDTAAAHLRLYPDGDLILSDCDVKINATKKLYLDGGGNTYIDEQTSDFLRIVVGNDTVLSLKNNGADGNAIHFADSCAGFTLRSAVYDAATSVADFRLTNKLILTLNGNTDAVSCIFPEVSGNFTLLVKQDGTGGRTVTNWKVSEFDESGADGDVNTKFPGGTNPTLTTDANHVDIISFFWDAASEICYGVASLDFQD